MKIGLREVIFVILLLAIPAGAWWLVFRPNNERNEEMVKLIEAKRLKLTRLNQTTAKIGGLKREIADLRKAVATLHAKLPSEKEIDKVLSETWMLAEANDLKTASIQTLRRKADQVFTDSGSTYSEQPVSVKVRGNFMGFYAFLQQLERRPRIMRIHKVTLSKAQKGQQGDVEADFVMSIFFDRRN